jgi:peptidoglycan/LPS O-acetylase OafA/YrhL
MKYIKELDAVRGLAILSVVASHWFPSDSFLHKGAEAINAPNIFFTISGFLITKILLGDRAKAEQYEYSKLFVFRNFFFKRVLRIFPAYYLLLFLFYLINTAPFNYAPYLSFTSNFYIYSTKDWGPVAHLWSMAVEEQFYLIWPWLILFINKKLLPYTIFLFVVIGIVSHWMLPDNEFRTIVTSTCFDALALGALFAWVITYHPGHLPKVYTGLSVLAAISLVLFIISLVAGSFYMLPKRTLTAVMIVWLLAYFLTKQHPARKLGFIFKNNLLISIGKMSYGIYLYHTVLPFYFHKIYAVVYSYVPVPMVLQKSRYFYPAQSFILLLCVSWLSWKFFEMPIQNLKKYFKTPTSKIPRPSTESNAANLPQADRFISEEQLQLVLPVSKDVANGQ